jgi:hypothetical protein
MIPCHDHHDGSRLAFLIWKLSRHYSNYDSSSIYMLIIRHDLKHSDITWFDHAAPQTLGGCGMCWALPAKMLQVLIQTRCSCLVADFVKLLLIVADNFCRYSAVSPGGNWVTTSDFLRLPLHSSNKVIHFFQN